jgi:hypothetical protein
MATTTEQRGEIRTKLSWPISMWIPEAHRFFNGSSDNVSRSGVLLKMPLTVPIRAGSTVEINFPRTQRLAKEKGSFARIRSGRIVRVDRNNMLKEAKIGVAVAFN